MEYVGTHPDFSLPVFRCDGCNFGHTPGVSQTLLGEYYRTNYSEESGRQILTEGYQAWHLRRAREQIEFLKSVIDFSLIHNIIDVGCGIGMTAHAVREVSTNVRWLGVEFDDACRDHAQSKGLEVVAKYEGLKNEFDLVIASHVMEHFVHPTAFLSSATKLLIRSGFLFVEVPNESSFAVKKQVVLGVKGKAHISFYSRQSLLRIAASQGWKSLAFRPCGGADRYSIYSYYQQEKIWLRVLARLHLRRPYWRFRDSLFQSLWPASGAAMRAVFVRNSSQ